VHASHDTLGEYLAENEPVMVLWHHLDAVVGDESRSPSLAGLTLPAATIYLVGVFEGEVVQGGFRKFFGDASGDHALDTLQALREVGAHVCVELLEKALAIFPDAAPETDRSARLSQLSRLDAETPGAFDALDELFVAHVDSQSTNRVEKVDDLLLEYLKQHAAIRLKY
jgi:hypothetical protein